MFCPCCRKDIESTPKPIPTLFQTEVCSSCHEAATKIRDMWAQQEIDTDSYMLFEQFLQDRVGRGVLVKMYLEDKTIRAAIDQLRLLDQERL